MGKAPVGVARLAKKYGSKVVAFAGSVTPEATACNAAGIDAFFPIVRGITTLAEAMDPQMQNQIWQQLWNRYSVYYSFDIIYKFQRVFLYSFYRNTLFSL